MVGYSTLRLTETGSGGDVGLVVGSAYPSVRTVVDRMLPRGVAGRVGWDCDFVAGWGGMSEEVLAVACRRAREVYWTADLAAGNLRVLAEVRRAIAGSGCRLVLLGIHSGWNQPVGDGRRLFEVLSCPDETPGAAEDFAKLRGEAWLWEALGADASAVVEAGKFVMLTGFGGPKEWSVEGRVIT